MDDAISNMTAEYIWKNRDSGWVKNAGVVQAAIPQMCRLWADTIRDELASLQNCDINREIVATRFLVTVSKEGWGSRQIAFGCENRWRVDRTFFAIQEKEGRTEKEAWNELQLALDRARSDRRSPVEGEAGYPAYFYTQAFFDSPDMIKAITDELRSLACKLDKVLRETPPMEQNDDS